MKTINKILSLAVVMAFGLASTSCTDGNDWSVDKTFDRLFGVTEDNISVAAETTTATVTFKTVPDAEYYVIEVSTDTLYDEVPMGETNAIVFGAETKDLTTSPVVLEGLAGDTKYHLRMKSMSSQAAESTWSYYDDGGTFKTKAEQIFNDVPSGDIGENTIRLTWLAGAEVTHIEVTAAGDETATTINLTDEEKAAGEYTVTGLSPLTAYTFVIYNGETKRGTLTVSTAASMPAADYKVTLPETATSIDNDYINEVFEDAKAQTGESNVSVTIGITAGKTINIGGTDAETGDPEALAIPDGMSVTFFGLAGETVTLNVTKSVEIGGSHNYIRFNNVTLTDAGCDYFINQDFACNVGEIAFEGVDVTSYKNALVRLKGGSKGNIIGTLKIDDCYVTGHGGGYPVIQFKEAGEKVDNIIVSNTTFNGIGNSFILCGGSDGVNTIDITNCTFYNAIASGKYVIDANKLSPVITLSNVLFAKVYNDNTSAKGIRTSGTTNYDATYFTSDFSLGGGNAMKGAETIDYSSTDLFNDPENGDFTIKVDKYATIGDPRWYVTE